MKPSLNVNLYITEVLFFSHVFISEIGFFEYKPMLYFQIFSNSLKSREIGIFEVPSILYFVKLPG